MSRAGGQASIVGVTGAVMQCVHKKKAYAVKVPSGTPEQVLMKPLGDGGCYVYNILPDGFSNVACAGDKSCAWSGFGPHGVCRGVPKPQ